MSNVTTIIKLGAAVLITVAAIAIAIALFGQGADITRNSESDIKGISQVISSKKFDAYNSTEVSGSSVVNAVRMYGETDELTVSVKTNAAAAATTYKSTSKYAVSDSANANYINPVGTFTSTLTANANGIITQISFVQK
jgi:flagellar basal body-associated protein FliL